MALAGFVAIYLVLGMLVGLLAGLFGLGGGILIVPSLAFLLPAQGFPSTVAVHMALGSSLASVLFTSLSSVIAHARQDNVLWQVVWPLVPGLVLGVFFGAKVSSLVSGETLRWLFSVLVFMIALRFFWHARGSSEQDEVSRLTSSGAGGLLPPSWALLALGIVVGVLAAFLGLAGGIFLVLYLSYCRLPMAKVVGTSAVCGFPVALVGLLSFAYFGSEVRGTEIVGATGYVYWPAVAGIAATSVVFAPIGARWAKRWPDAVLKRCLAVFLIIIGVFMIIK